jgi:hypothetical protein
MLSLLSVLAGEAPAGGGATRPMVMKGIGDHFLNRRR